MRLQEKDIRALKLLAAALPIFLIAWWALGDDTEVPAPVLPVATDIPTAEKRLVRLREMAATVPGKRDALEQVSAELKQREQGLIQADTAAQAQEQLLQILRGLGKAEGIDMRNSEIGPVKAFSPDYGEASVALTFETRIEQLVNLLASLTAQKQIIGVNDLRVGRANPKLKTMPVRITISTLVRRELVPQKKGPGSL